MADPNTDDVEQQTRLAADGISRRTALRAFLALICSHAVAPYATARFTIRLLLDGTPEPAFGAGAAFSIAMGACLAYRQFVPQPTGRKLLYGLTLVVLWFAMSVVQLAIAADSAIPRPLLATLWGCGTIWIAWLVWAWSFFNGRSIVIGTLMAASGAIGFWMTVDITGLTGDAAVEFAWRKRLLPDLPDPQPGTSANTDPGEIVWAGYLGNKRAGTVNDVTLSENWASQPPKERWRVPCGAGWSSFAATESVLFSQEQINGKDCVTARQRATGKLIWRNSESREGFVSGLGGDGPRATPALGRLPTDEESIVVYSIGPAGLLKCIAASDGSTIWETDVMVHYPGENLVHAVCGSPLLIDDLVIVCPPSEGGPCLAAFQQADGQPVWQCTSGWRTSYSSPVTMEINATSQIVIHAGKGVLAVDPQDGKTLWQFEWTNEWDNNATQPLPVPGTSDQLIVATGYRGGAARIQIDKESTTPTIIWESRRTMRTKFCNVALFGNVLVGLDNGILCGVDIGTGGQLWKQGRYGHGQLLPVGDHLLVVSEKGRLHLLKPSVDSHNELASAMALDRKTWNHPILLDGQLIVRNDQEIVCLDLPLPGSSK